MSSAQIKLEGSSAKPIVARKEESRLGIMLIVCMNFKKKKKAREQIYMSRSSAGIDLA